MSSLPHKNILVLIISSNNEPVYKDHKSVNRSMAESFKNMDDIDIGYTMYMLKIYPIRIHDVLVIDSISALEQHIDNIQSKKICIIDAKIKIAREKMNANV